MATGFLKGAGSPEALDISHALSINYLISPSPTIAALPVDPSPGMYLASYSRAERDTIGAYPDL